MNGCDDETNRTLCCGQSIRVMTWNVHSAGSSPRDVLAVIERQSPDILCLQEIK